MPDRVSTDDLKAMSLVWLDENTAVQKQQKSNGRYVSIKCAVLARRGRLLSALEVGWTVCTVVMWTSELQSVGFDQAA